MKKITDYTNKKPNKWLFFAVIVLTIIITIKTTTHFIEADENIQQEVVIADEVDPLPLPPITEPTKEQVKEEIIRQAELFSLSPQIMLKLAECESGFRWDAKNSNSTATGVFQYLIGTWGQTASSRKGISRLDYKANIREAMIDVSNKEEWRWQECLDKANLTFN